MFLQKSVVARLEGAFFSEHPIVVRKANATINRKKKEEFLFMELASGDVLFKTERKRYANKNLPVSQNARTAYLWNHSCYFKFEALD
jgi:hypothetical protein